MTRYNAFRVLRDMGVLEGVATRLLDEAMTLGVSSEHEGIRVKYEKPAFYVMV